MSRLAERLTKLKLATIGVLGLIVIPLVAAAATVKADTIPPSIETGDIFWSRNLTKSTQFADSTNADACEEVQYRVRIHNAGQDNQSLRDVTVQASIPGQASTRNVATIIIRASNAVPSSASDTTTVNISTAQKVIYTPGSTQLLDAQGNVIRGLSDAITGAGVNIGDVGVSINEKRFVQFKAKIDCPQPPQPQPAFKCTGLNISAEDRTVRITNFTTSQSNGATFKHAVIDWGDGSDRLTTAEPVGKTHTYSRAGTYTIAATAVFTVNGQEVSDTGPECMKQVTFSDKQDVPPKVVTVTTPTAAPPAAGQQPASLANVGPGASLASVALIALLASYGYRRYLLRKLEV